MAPPYSFGSRPEAVSARRARRRQPGLVNCYQAVRDDVDGVIAVLRKHRNDRALYYRVRRRDPAKLSPAARAARFIYLNRCGYNGLYRVNSRGRFNVPFGSYSRPVICDERSCGPPPPRCEK